MTRSSNPGQVVKAFLENLAAIQAWHQRAQALHKFVVLDKQLPIFERARRLAAAVNRAREVPEAAEQLGAQAFEWREGLVDMISTGKVAEKWDQFQAIHTPLKAQFQRAYEALHTQRAEALEGARAKLEGAEVSAVVLRPYGCPGLGWATDGLGCGECGAALHELPTQIVAIPSLARQQLVREQEARLKTRQDDGRTAVNVPLSTVLGGREISDATDRDRALGDLKQVIDEALQDADFVTLV